MKRRWVYWAMTTALIALICVAAGWAAGSIFRPVQDPLEVDSATYASVVPGEVGESLTLNSVATWLPTPAGGNQAVGTVTGIAVHAGDEVAQGTVLYTVDLRPVVAAQGEIPSFRSIGEDTTGADVAQLQSMLAALGFYRGQADGKAQAGTVSAIKAWQKALGVEQTGVVESGDVVFVPSLPTRISLDSELVARGVTLSGGEQVVRALPPAPEFSIPVTEAQAQRISVGTQVEITAPDGQFWAALAGEHVRDEATQTVVIKLTSETDQPICMDDCALVPVTGDAQLRSRIVTVPSVAGLVVPSAALTTDASGDIAVVDDEGERVAVSVTASAKGMSVVTGAREGMRVRVPAPSE